MPLHVYVENGSQKKLVVVLSSQTLKALEPIFQQFRKSTGVLISEYEDSIIAPNHAKLIQKIIDEHFIGKSIPVEILSFRKELESALNLDLYIYTIGE